MPLRSAADLPGRRVQLVSAVLALGIGLRVIQYLGNRSLWLDEALVAPVIVDTPFRELLSPAVWGASPPLFLLLERLAVAALGSGELALRLVPLLGGIAALFLFLRVARRSLSPEAVLPALALFAVSPFLVYYASEIKPYSTDAAVALLLILLALRMQQEGVTRRRAAWLGLGGVAAVGLSYPAAIVLAGVMVGLLAHFGRARDGGAVRRLLLVCALWGVAFGVPYLFVVHGVAANPYVQAFWKSGFMPFPPRSASEWMWFPHALVRTFEEPLGVLDAGESRVNTLQAVAGILVCGAGCVGLALTRRRTALLILAAPILVTLAVSGFQKYPFGSDWSTGGRVLLFLAPAFYLLMGEGVARLWTASRPSLRVLAIPVIAMLFVPLGAQAAVAFPMARAELKPVLGYVRENWREGDVLFVQYDTRQAFEYYGERYGFRPGDYRHGACARFEPHRYLEELSGLRGRSRVWVLFGGGKGAFDFDEKALMLDYLSTVGVRVDDRIARGASVYLYDLRPRPDDRSAFRARIPNFPSAIEEGCALWGGP